MNFAQTRMVLDSALAERAFPAAVIEVGRLAGPVWSYACGRLTFESDTPATSDTIFDLASLTKVMATTSLVMRAVDAGVLTIETPVGAWLSGWTAGARSQVRLRHLLDHSSGLPAHDRYWEVARGRSQFEQIFQTVSLAGPPGTTSVYSDPGFMLLGFVIEDAGEAPLSTQFKRFADAARLGEVRYGIDPAWLPRVAPTEVDPWRGRLLTGDVHDENAAALGGVAGHSGLFGTAAAVGTFAQLVLRTFRAHTSLGTPETMVTFATPTGVPGSSRALGWDTMLPTSSCGRRLSPRAIGHTGFTGTSLWIDWERDLYVVLLSNRVHPTRSNDRFVAVRPRVHDAVVHDLEGS